MLQLDTLSMLPLLLIWMGLATRASSQFSAQSQEMISHLTKKQSTEFENYGCWCNFKNRQDYRTGVVDKVDGCCRQHVDCYSSLMCNTENVLVYSSVLKSAWVQCTNPEGSCEYEVCNCDRQLAICLREQQYSFNQVKFGSMTKEKCQSGLHSMSACDKMKQIPRHTKCTKPRWSRDGVTVGVNLWYPNGLVIDQSDTIFVADQHNHRIQQFLPNSIKGVVVAGGNEKGNGSAQLNQPFTTFVDNHKNLWVSDTGNNRIQKFFQRNPMGLTIVGGRFLSNTSRFTPTGLFIDDAGNILLSDTANNRVLKFSTSSVAGIAIIAPGELSAPTNIYVDRCNTLYVTDRLNHRIRRYPNLNQSAGTTILGVDKKEGQEFHELNTPACVTLDPYGNLYVSDTKNHRIQRLSVRDGKVQNIAGYTNQVGSAEKYLNHPSGIGLDSQGNLFVADTNNYRIQKFSFLEGDLWC